MNLAAIAFRRLGLVACTPAAADATIEQISLDQRIGLAAAEELAHLGVRIRNPDAVSADLITGWGDLHAAIIDVRGGQLRHAAPLFAGFPEKLPAYDNASLRFSFAALRLVARGALQSMDGDTIVVTDTDLRAALDFSDTGWWPASSVPQDPDVAAVAKRHQEILPGDTRVEWIDITLSSPADVDMAVRNWMLDSCYSPSSLRPEVLDEVRYLTSVYGVDHIDTSRVRFGEIRAVINRAVFEADPDQLAASTSPDDLLRLLAELGGGDIALGEKLRVPNLTQAQRRGILATLDRSPRTGDVWRRRGLWLTVARSLHYGDYTSRYPTASAALTALANTHRDHTTAASQFEAAFPGDPTGAATQLRHDAPTVLIRNLRRVAKVAGPIGWLLDDGLADVVPLRTLLTVRAVVSDNDRTYPRLVTTKRGGTLLRDTANIGHLPADVVVDLCEALDSVIAKRVAAFGSWADDRVWVDPTLDQLLIPDEARTTTDGMLHVDRGSRIPVGDAAVLRLFTHWVQPPDAWSDLDLSVVALDANYRPVDQVSWTNLANAAATHSGDLTSAPPPDGAVEFLDIRLDHAATQPRWRYLAPTIYRYSGPSFAELPQAIAGWMLRDKASSDRATFDIKTVANAFRLNSRGKATAVPFVYDILHREIIYLDVFMSSPWQARTETHAELSTLAAAVVNRSNIRANLEELARLHACHRGAVLVDDRESASITFGLDDTATYNALRPQTILTDLL